MEARVNVNENDVVNVKNGDEANISIDAYPGRPFRGTVYQIANTAVTTGENTQEEVTNFEVRLHINGEGARLRPGMSATADVETATVRDVVAVPIQSVTLRMPATSSAPTNTTRRSSRPARRKRRATATPSNSKKARKPPTRQGRAQEDAEGRLRENKDNTVQMRPVETGIADNAYLEVKGGVQPGEEIVSGSYRAISRLLADGAKVMLEKAAQ